MKRFWMWLWGLAACTAMLQAQGGSAADVARAAVEAFRKGDYKAFDPLQSAETRAKFPEAAFRSAVQELGPFTIPDTAPLTRQVDGNAAFVFPAKFSEHTLDLLVALNVQNRLVRFWFGPHEEAWSAPAYVNPALGRIPAIGYAFDAGR